MPGHLRRRFVAATAALLVAASVGGCSGDADEAQASDTTPSASATGSTSPSPSPTDSASVAPEPRLPRRPAAKDSAAGREAFAEFVIARWGYALQTNDATALTDLSPTSAPCEGCAELRAELRTRKQDGWYVDFPGAKIVELQVEPGELPGVQVANATINVPASESYFDDGELRNENAAHKSASFEVRMRLDGNHYVLLAFRVG